jgi:hypothetical protein
MAVIKDIKGPRVSGGTTERARGTDEAAPADETQPDLPAVGQTLEVPDDYSRAMLALPDGTPDLDDPGSPQALKAVHTLMPDLDTIRDLADVAPRFVADLQMVGADLLAAPQLSPEDKATRLFTFFTGYAERFVELATSGEDATPLELPTEKGAKRAKVPDIEILPMDLQEPPPPPPGLPEGSPQHEEAKKVFAALRELDFRALGDGEGQAVVLGLAWELLTAQSAEEYEVALEEAEKQLGKLRKLERRQGRRLSSTRLQAHDAQETHRRADEAKEITRPRGKPLSKGYSGDAATTAPLPAQAESPPTPQPQAPVLGPEAIVHLPAQQSGVIPLAAMDLRKRRRPWQWLQNFMTMKAEESAVREAAWDRLAFGAIVMLTLMALLAIVLVNL